MEIAKNADVKSVLDLLEKNGLEADDVESSGRDIIVTLNEAISRRLDMLDITPLGSGTWNDLVNDMDHLREWKADGVKYVYIDSDIYTLNGRCCLVYADNLKDYKKRVLETIKEG